MPHRFQKGNQVAKGNRGPWEKRKILTQALISQLNEIDEKTSKTKLHRVVQELLKHSMGFEVKTVRRDAKGKVIETIVEQIPSSVQAISAVFDRVEGRPRAADDGEAGRTVTLVFPPAVGEL